MPRRFDIALSFPGRNRRLARHVATALGEALGNDRIFFDEWYQDELVGAGLNKKLRQIYRDESYIVVPFFSRHYKSSSWCTLEWNAIRAVLVERRDAVIPVVVDNTRIDGWEPVDVGISYRAKGSRTGRETAQRLIEVRLKLLKSDGRNATTEAASEDAARFDTMETTASNDNSCSKDSDGRNSREDVKAHGDIDSYSVVFFVPATLESAGWMLQLWDHLREFKTEQRFRQKCQLLDPVVSAADLRKAVTEFRAEKTIILVAFDSNRLQSADRRTLVDQTLDGIWDSPQSRPWIAGVIAAGTQPEDAFKVRDSGAHGAVPMSRLNDAEWFWPYLDDMVHRIRPRVPRGFVRGGSTQTPARQLVVTGSDSDAREIYASVLPVAMRLTGQTPLHACPASYMEVASECREMKERAHAVILRGRHSDESMTELPAGTERSEIGNAIGLYLAGAAGPAGLSTFCVANEREAPLVPPPEWRDFAYYAYRCEMDLALRLYEWLLVADDGDITQ